MKTSTNLRGDHSHQTLRKLCLAFLLIYNKQAVAQQAYIDSLLLVNESYLTEKP